MKADLHVHSSYSDHGTATLGEIMTRCFAQDLGCIALTDHATLEGARRLSEIAAFKVIVGQEVMTRDGEVTGLFIEDSLEPNRPLADTVEEIKSQGGLVYVPHPCERVRFKRSLNVKALAEVIDQIDVLEVFNGRATLGRFNAAAEMLAKTHGITMGAGSDAHSAAEIGTAFVEMGDWQTKEDFLRALSAGRIFGHRSSLTVHVGTLVLKLRTRVARRRI